MLAVGAFCGFESSASLGIEARSPHRAIPRAVLLTVLAAGLLSIVAAYGEVLGFGSAASLAQSSTPLNSLSATAGVGWLAYFLDLARRRPKVEAEAAGGQRDHLRIALQMVGRPGNVTCHRARLAAPATGQESLLAGTASRRLARIAGTVRSVTTGLARQRYAYSAKASSHTQTAPSPARLWRRKIALAAVLATGAARDPPCRSGGARSD